MPDIERDFADQALGPCRMGFWLDGERLVTARRHPLAAAEKLRDAVEGGEVPAPWSGNRNSSSIWSNTG